MNSGPFQHKQAPGREWGLARGLAGSFLLPRSAPSSEPHTTYSQEKAY